MIRKNWVKFFGLLAFGFLFSFGFNVLAQTKPAVPPAPPIVSSSFLPASFPSPEEFQKLSPAEQQKAVLKLQADMEKNLENNPLERCQTLFSSLYDSVEFGLFLERSAYQPGDKISFPGPIRNKNKEPIFDGLILLRVTREDKVSVQGNDIIEEIVLAKDIVLPGLGEFSPTLSWQVPEGLPSGKYRANFYFSTGNGRFSASGNPAVKESTGHSLRFTIDGPSKSGVVWKSSLSKVNNTPYQQVVGATVPSGKTATVSHTLVNKGLRSLTLTITQESFYTDGFQTYEPLDKQTKNVTLLPGKEETISYQTPVLSSSSYYIKFTAQAEKEAKAIAIARLTVASSTASRLRYATLLNFPQKKDGKPTTAIACLANNNPPQEGNTLSLTLLNKEGKVLLTQSTTSLALSISLPLNSPLEKIAFLAEVKNKAGQVTDSYQSAYNCSLLGGGASCPKQSPASTNQTSSIKVYVILISILALVLVSIFGYLFIKKRYE